MKLASLLLAAMSLLAADRQRFVLVLEDPPLAAQAGSKATSKAALVDRQATLRKALESRKIRVMGANHILANVLFVEAAPDSATELSQLPGVRHVERVRPMKMHLSRALDLIKVPAAWSAVNGSQNAGAGVKIAILDSGIDNSHPALQDNSLQMPAGFPKCIEARGDCAYTNNKVIAARSYVEMLAGTDPAFSRPDDLSPRDRVGHGTAVAMAAAGVRTQGPAATVTGVAPKAWLGNYKVFGSPGVNGQYTEDRVLLQALEDALNDGMNIANFSLGAPAVWGPRDRASTCGKESGKPCDWRADAIENAALRGLTVVVSAGNDGDYATEFPAYNSIQTPGTAPSAITVGATTNQHIWYQGLRIQGANVPADLRSIPALFGNGPRPAAPITAEVRDVSKLDDDGKACSPLTNGSLTGSIALIQRGDCDYVAKINHAARAGAVGVILYQREGLQGVFSVRDVTETSIPAMLIGNRRGVELKNYLAQNPTAQATMDPALYSVTTTEFDTVADLSSRGPSIGEHGIKPEVVAVGTDLYVATQKYDPNGDMYDPSGFTAVSGTSFAAPLVSGVAAMVKQRNPGWTPAQIKSAIVNTAGNDVFEFGQQVQARIIEVGAGKLNAGDAVRTNVTVEPATLAFGVIESATLPNRRLTINNHSNAPLNLRFEVQARRDNPDRNARVTLDRSSADVPAGSSINLTVSLQGSKPAPGSYEGFVVVTGGAVPLRIPFLYLVGDGIPFSILPLEGDAFVRNVNSFAYLTLKVTDRYGVPVKDVATRYQSTYGGGYVDKEAKTTDALGISYADVVLGEQHGEQEFYVAVGNQPNFGYYFVGRSRLKPSIQGGGVVDAASLRVGQGLAPGSYVTIYGQGLSEVTRVFNTPYLPLSLANVSVSFDVPSKNISVPGRIHFVSPNQINLQIPWELQGSSSAMMKVSIGDSSSAVYTVPLSDHSPSAFEYSEAASGRMLVAAQDTNFALIGTGNPAKKGSVIQVYANGLGPLDRQPPSGEPASGDNLSSTKGAISVTIGSRPAEVLFSGLAPGNIGLYQVNVRVPEDAPSGLQALSISANGIMSKSVTLPVQ